MRKIIVLTLIFLLTAYSTSALGQDSAQVDIYSPNQSPMHFVLAQPLTKQAQGAAASGPDTAVPATAASLQSLLSNNLSYLPFLQEIPGRQIPGGIRLDGYSKEFIDFKRFQLANVDILITAAWLDGGRTVELRAYNSFTNSLIVGKAYHDVTQEKLPLLADRFCEALMTALTGTGEFFRSTLAFTKTEGNNANVWLVRPTGRDLRKITAVPGIAMSPHWSRDGRYIVFSVVAERNHMIGMWDRQTRKIQLKPNPSGTVIGPSFTPDNRVLVSLSQKGTTPNIFVLDHTLRQQTPLVQSWANDVSPRMDKTGRRMVFVSDRLGGPQIFNFDTASGAVTRLTTEGGYNSEPSLSPDGTLLTYSRMAGGGTRIFVRDLTTGIDRQVSFGPGRDEQPSFCADGYFIAFTSNRNGANRVFLTTRHGTPAKMVETGSGNAKFPSFGLTEQ